MSSPRILLSATLAALAVLIAAFLLLRSPAAPTAQPESPPASSTATARENRLLPAVAPSADSVAASSSQADPHESFMSPLEAEASAQRAADAAERAAERAIDRGIIQ
jgi:hypothetical protein